MPESSGLLSRALAVEPVGVFSAKYRARHYLPILSTVSTAVRRPTVDSQIDSVDGVYRIINPLFECYLRKIG